MFGNPIQCECNSSISNSETRLTANPAFNQTHREAASFLMNGPCRDGAQLAQFMIDFNVGVSPVKKIDSDYFEEDG